MSYRAPRKFENLDASACMFHLCIVFLHVHACWVACLFLCGCVCNRCHCFCHGSYCSRRLRDVECFSLCRVCALPVWFLMCVSLHLLFACCSCACVLLILRTYLVLRASFDAGRPLLNICVHFQRSAGVVLLSAQKQMQVSVLIFILFGALH